METKSYRPDPKLPPEVNEQLARLAKLEEENALLRGMQVEQQQKLVDLGVRLADAGEIPIEIDTPEGKKTVYRYLIDLPPSGGISIGINGIQYFHGQAYEFEAHQLSTVREMIYRAWDHERNIKGSDENAYRPQLQPKLSGKRLGR